VSKFIYQPVLSVKQPWAWLLTHPGLKDCENRSRSTNIRGRVWIHAGKQFDAEGWQWVKDRDLLDQDQRVLCLSESFVDRGGIVGSVEIVDSVETCYSPWFGGPWGWLCDNAAPCEFVPCRGQLGFFKVTCETGKGCE
jgi:hypothetical protein